MCRGSGYEGPRISEVERKLVVAQLEITEDVRRGKTNIPAMLSPSS